MKGICMLISFALLYHLPTATAHRPGRFPVSLGGWSAFNPSLSSPWRFGTGPGTPLDMINRFASPFTNWISFGGQGPMNLWPGTLSGMLPNNNVLNDFGAVQIPNSDLNRADNQINNIGSLNPGSNPFPFANRVNNQFPFINGIGSQFLPTNDVVSPFPFSNGVNQFPLTNDVSNQFPLTSAVANQFSPIPGANSQFPVTFGISNQNLQPGVGQFQSTTGFQGTGLGELSSSSFVSNTGGGLPPWQSQNFGAGMGLPNVRADSPQWLGSSSTFRR